MHSPPSKRQDISLSQFLLSPCWQWAAASFFLQHCPSPAKRWFCCSGGCVGGDPAPYPLHTLPIQLGGIGSSSSADKRPFPWASGTMNPTINPAKGEGLLYALLFHCQTSQEDVLHPEFFYRQKEKIHSSIQSLCLSLPPLPFPITFQLETEFCSRQVTYGSRLSQEGIWLERIAQTMRELAGGEAQRERRAENYSNTEKRPPETQFKYLSSVSAAVSEDSVKARIFVLQLVTWKINREQEQEAKCSAWFIWMSQWLFYGYRNSD